MHADDHSLHGKRHSLYCLPCSTAEPAQVTRRRHSAAQLPADPYNCADISKADRRARISAGRHPRQISGCLLTGEEHEARPWVRAARHTGQLVFPFTHICLSLRHDTKCCE